MIFLPDEKQPKPYYVDKHRFVGEFDIPDGLVDITDPCYDRTTWCAKNDFHIKPGKYKCYVFTAEFPTKVRYEKTDTEVITGKKRVMQVGTLHDRRIVTLIIEHVNIKESPKKDDKNIWEEVSTAIGVDAGMCGFYNHKPEFNDNNTWTNFWENAKHLPGYRWLTCDIKPYGVTVSSGFGDGMYPLYAYKENDEIVALKLEFC